jgi:hypothetical protein
VGKQLIKLKENHVISNTQVDRRVAGELIMAGPKYANVEASNSYSPMGDKRHGDIVMTGPVYPHVESSNKVFFFWCAPFGYLYFRYFIVCTSIQFTVPGFKPTTS